MDYAHQYSILPDRRADDEPMKIKKYQRQHLEAYQNRKYMLNENNDAHMRRSSDKQKPHFCNKMLEAEASPKGIRFLIPQKPNIANKVTIKFSGRKGLSQIPKFAKEAIVKNILKDFSKVGINCHKQISKSESDVKKESDFDLEDAKKRLLSRIIEASGKVPSSKFISRPARSQNQSIVVPKAHTPYEAYSSMVKVDEIDQTAQGEDQIANFKGAVNPLEGVNRKPLTCQVNIETAVENAILKTALPIQLNRPRLSRLKGGPNEGWINWPENSQQEKNIIPKRRSPIKTVVIHSNPFSTVGRGFEQLVGKPDSPELVGESKSPKPDQLKLQAQSLNHSRKASNPEMGQNYPGEEISMKEEFDQEKHRTKLGSLRRNEFNLQSHHQTKSQMPRPYGNRFLKTKDIFQASFKGSIDLHSFDAPDRAGRNATSIPGDTRQATESRKQLDPHLILPQIASSGRKEVPVEFRPQSNQLTGWGNNHEIEDNSLEIEEYQRRMIPGSTVT